MKQRIDVATMIGLGLLLMPLLTMWHEIGGHVTACVVQGGHVATLGAFYVDCTGLVRAQNVIVACAGAGIDTLLTVVSYRLWRRANGDVARLVLWLVWVSKGFVAAGYLCFSAVSGVGDLGPTAAGGIGPLPLPWVWRAGELAAGVALYVWLVRLGIRTLGEMIGTAPAANAARKRIAHVFYATVGASAVLVGLLNPVGLFITIMSAAASSFGGNAGFISIGFAGGRGDVDKAFVIPRSWGVIAVGAVTLTTFALALGPSRSF